MKGRMTRMLVVSEIGNSYRLLNRKFVRLTLKVQFGKSSQKCVTLNEEEGKSQIGDIFIEFLKNRHGMKEVRKATAMEIFMFRKRVRRA